MNDEERKEIEQSILGIKSQEDNFISHKLAKKTGVNLNDDKPKSKEPVKTTITNFIPPPTKKDDLKRCIIDMCAELGEPRPNSTFFRQTKAVLEDKVKELTKKLEDKALGLEEEKKRRALLLDHPEKDPVAMSLYHMNAILAQSAEAFSTVVKNKTFDIALLEGLTDEITKKRESFLRIFARLSQKHGEIISRYLSPTTEYIVLMGSCVVPVIDANLKKKGNTLGDQSKNSNDNTGV